jgi:endoglycosylceramidase
MAVTLIAPTALPASPAGGIHAEGGRLVDAQGRTVILRGINAMDKTLGADGDRDPNLSAADFERIASIGFNTLRLGTSWAAIEPAPGVYDDAFIGRFRLVMDAAAAHGLLVVVDMHQDVWGESLGGNGAPDWAAPQCNVPPRVPLAETTGQWFAQYGSPDTLAAFGNFWADGAGGVFCTGAVQTRFVEMFGHLASRLAGHPALVGYDLFNEPWPGTPPVAFEVLQLYPFYERLVAEIRAVDDGSVVFFEPPIQKSAGIPTVPVGLSDGNAIFAPHVYTETMFSSGAVTTDAVTDEIVIVETLAEAAAMDVPAWIGEWGAFENDNAERYQRAFYALLDRYQIGGAYWQYTQGYTDGLQVQPASADAGHLRVYPEAFPGAAEWLFDPAARTFDLSLELLGGDARTASVVLPARLYPTGFAVEADGTTSYDPAGNRLTWTLDGSGTHALRIRPA